MPSGSERRLGRAAGSASRGRAVRKSAEEIVDKPAGKVRAKRGPGRPKKPRRSKRDRIANEKLTDERLGALPADVRERVEPVLAEARALVAAYALLPEGSAEAYAAAATKRLHDLERTIATFSDTDALLRYVALQDPVHVAWARGAISLLSCAIRSQEEPTEDEIRVVATAVYDPQPWLPVVDSALLVRLFRGAAGDRGARDHFNARMEERHQRVVDVLTGEPPPAAFMKAFRPCLARARDAYVYEHNRGASGQKTAVHLASEMLCELGLTGNPRVARTLAGKHRSG